MDAEIGERVRVYPNEEQRRLNGETGIVVEDRGAYLWVRLDIDGKTYQAEPRIVVRAGDDIPPLSFHERIALGSEYLGDHELADEAAALVPLEYDGAEPLVVRLRALRGRKKSRRMVAGLGTRQVAILGELLEGPMTVNELESAMARADWRCDWSRQGLYAALPVLARRGLVESQKLPRDGLKPRTLWRITDDGELAMDRWVEEVG